MKTSYKLLNLNIVWHLYIQCSPAVLPPGYNADPALCQVIKRISANVNYRGTMPSPVFAIRQ